MGLSLVALVLWFLFPLIGMLLMAVVVFKAVVAVMGVSGVLVYGVKNRGALACVTCGYTWHPSGAPAAEAIPDRNTDGRRVRGPFLVLLGVVLVSIVGLAAFLQVSQ